jgi:outer membrane autotransporter protein
MNTPTFQNGNALPPFLHQPATSSPDKRHDATSTFKPKLATLCALLFLSAFGLQLAALSQPTANDGTLSVTPLLPSTSGTYYYEGFDSANSRHVFIQDTIIYTGTTFSDLAGYADGTVKYVIITNGTYFLHGGIYCYVDTGGNTTPGATTHVNTTSPYRTIVTDGIGNFQFYNNHTALYASTTLTGTDGVTRSAFDYSVRSGTWFAHDITLSLEADADASALWIEGVSAAFSTTTANTTPVTGNLVNYANDTARVLYPQPVTFSGTNVNILVTIADNSSRQALSIRNGGSVFLYGGTISKTVTTTGDGSETIYLIGNQEEQGSSAHLYGEDLTIISTGTALEAINQGNGRTTVELHRSTITATIGAANANTQVFNLNDQQNQGGAHFYGESLAINVTNTGPAPVRTFAFGYGANTITLKDSTLTTSGTKGAVFRWKTSEGTGGNAGGNEAMADGFVSRVTLENTNITTTAAYAPIFQQTGRLGWATVTGGTLTTTGSGSPIIRLVGANDAHDETKFTGIFTNTLLEARNSSAIDLDMFARDSTNYGEDGGGIGKEVTTLITTAWDLIFFSSTLSGASAMRLATAGAYNSPYSNDTRLSAFDSTIIGRIEMDAGADVTGSRLETTGANLTVQGRNSHFIGGFYMTGTEIARKYHQATLDLLDSTWEGDIIGVNRGVFLAKFINTPMTGNITVSGSIISYLDFINSPIDGGVYLDGTATLINTPGLDVDNRRATIRNSAITGGFNLAGSSYLDLTFDGPETIVSGGITATDTATGIFRFEDNSSINGGVTVSGTSSVTIILSDVNQLTGDLFINDRAHLALATFAGTPIHLNRNIDLAGIWGITGQTTLAGLLEITHPLGTISINNASPDILTLTGGFTGNGRLDIVSIDGASLGTDEIRVIHDMTGNFAPDALILSHPVDYVLGAYDIDNRPDGAYLVNSSYGTGGAAVFNSQALMVEDWLVSLLPINNRLSELRQTNATLFSGDSTGGPAKGDAGALWLQVRADTTQVDVGSNSLNFDSRTIGLTVGLDARWDSDTASLSSGIFADTARTDRDFIDAADGSSDSIGGGLYLHYHHRKGLFASAIARFDTCENTLDTHSPNNALKADYNTQAGGVAIDIGWRFALANTGWWYELAYQLTLATFPGTSYDTQSTRPENNIAITTEDARATQNLFRFAFGKALGRQWGFHGYLAAATVSASGGEFAARHDGSLLLDRASFTLAGDRVEASIGLSRQIGHVGRLALNATYIEAANYQRPCTFSIGYSHAW